MLASGGTALQEHTGPLGSDDPQGAVGFGRQKLFDRHRYPLKITRRCSPLTRARRYCSSEGEVKVKQTTDGRPETGDWDPSAGRREG